MVAGSRARRRTSGKKPWRLSESAESELLALCPGCKALEVMRFTGQTMTPTRNFAQKADGVYHSCGAGVPCRLFRSGTRPPGVAGQELEGHAFRTRPARRAWLASVPVREVANGVVDLDTGRGPGGPHRRAD